MGAATVRDLASGPRRGLRIVVVAQHPLASFAIVAGFLLADHDPTLGSFITPWIACVRPFDSPEELPGSLALSIAPGLQGHVSRQR